MSRALKTLFTIAMALLVTGCKEKNYTYEYLVEHTNLLEKQYMRCKSISIADLTTEQEKQCKIVNNAVKTITDTIIAQRSDPEKFGLRILVAEIAMQDYQNQLSQAEDELMKLKTQSASEKDVKTASDEVGKLREAYNNKKDEVTMLLSIMGMTTPE